MKTGPGGTIVVGVDGTSGSAGALRYGLAEARGCAADVRLVHVFPQSTGLAALTGPTGAESLAAAGATILESAAREAAALQSDVSTSGVLMAGDAVDGLLDAANDARLLVVGAEGRHGLERLHAGAVSDGVASHASVPVVSVPEHWMPGEPYGRLVVGLKGPAHADALFRSAFERAHERRWALRVVHAWTLPDAYLDQPETHGHPDAWHREAEAIIDMTLADWRAEFPSVTVDVTVVHGMPAEMLMREAVDADEILLLRSTQWLFPHHLGVTARRVLHACPCPVWLLQAHDSDGAAP